MNAPTEPEHVTQTDTESGEAPIPKKGSRAGVIAAVCAAAAAAVGLAAALIFRKKK